MRLAITDTAPAAAPAVDPAAPNLTYLAHDFRTALQSFFATMARIMADNPVPIARLQELAVQARTSPSGDSDASELRALQAQALRQARAVAATIGFFLKYSPYPMLQEIRQRGQLFQPPFGPVLVVEGDAVRDVLERNQEFTVEPYGVEMIKVMSPRYNGGFTTFILSTDDDDRRDVLGSRRRLRRWRCRIRPARRAGRRAVIPARATIRPPAAR